VFVTVTAELPLVAAPIVVHLYKSFEEHFFAEEFFDVHASLHTYLFQCAALVAYQYPALALPFDIYHGPYAYDILLLQEFLRLHLDRIRHFLLVVEQYFLAYYLIDEKTLRFVGQRIFRIIGRAFRKRLDELGELLGFQELLGRTVNRLSGGQRRRIDIARALLHRPRILILDEPTTGLDPQTRSLVWQVVEQLRRKEGITVFLTTHYMEEAADADYVVILDKGKIAAEGTPLQLKNTYTGDFLTLYGVTESQVQALGLPYSVIRDAFRVSVSNTAVATELIVKHPALFRDYEITKGRMDDVFLAVTGKKLMGGMAE